MSVGPLEDERLRAVEACLNEARYDEAQKRLAGLGSIRGLGPGVAYLTARLLFERGRIDRAALLQRLQDLLADWPDFDAARVLLEAHGGVPSEAPTLRASLGVRMSGATHVAVSSRRPTVPAPRSAPAGSAPPVRLETPRIPEWASDPRALGTANTQPLPAQPRGVVQIDDADAPKTERGSSLPAGPGSARAASSGIELGELDPPRSEMPTEPAPPPSEQEAQDIPAFEAEERRVFSRAVWDALEMELVNQHVEHAFQGLEKLASTRLDRLLLSELPALPDVAGVAADFLTTAPVTSHFAPFDLSLDSIERIDAVLALFAQAPNRGSPYALTVLLTAYIGECVRGAAGGHWQGRLVEPEEARVERRSGEVYVPWARVQRALALGAPLRADAGPRPHPAAEPPERPKLTLGEPSTPWAPELWPDITSIAEIGRALPSSVIGAWAARVAKHPLDRTPASLPAIDRYLTLLMPHPPGSGDAAAARRPAVLVGAYIGDLLCLHAAGRWSENDAAPLGPLRYEVLMPDGSAAYPVLWTYDRLRGRGKLSLTERVENALSH
jgi:hypothetical protein